MPNEFRTTRQVEFHETDMAGIVHFSVMFRWMEACEHAFLRSLGCDPHAGAVPDGQVLGWPRVHASCDYRKPFRFGETVEVRLQVVEKKERALRYRFEIHGGDEPLPRVTGEMVSVPVARIAGVVQAVALPASLAECINLAPDAP